MCDKVDKKTLLYEHEQLNAEMVPFYFHNTRTRPDKKLERKVLEQYEKNFSSYQEVLCKNRIDVQLMRNSEEEVILGNLKSDLLKDVGTLMNDSALRTIWYSRAVGLRQRKRVGYSFFEKYYMSKLEFINGTSFDNDTIYTAALNDYVLNNKFN